MSNVISLATKIITYLFTNTTNSSNPFTFAPFGWVVYAITRQPYLFVGTMCLVIGFVISIIRRIIKT